ncbi:MAG TPA: PilW family protein, partial [Burkholderiales bacterium]|nr:PilW family protein [Burkholderiales bacterium]
MRPFTSARAARGFSMVELMVAMTIGLIGVIIIFQVFETSEGVRRTTVAGGDAQQNGAIALYSLEHDLRNGGMGVNDTPYAGCNIVGYDSARSTPNFPTAGNTMVLAPVQITFGADAQTPDSISVFYGSQIQIANSTTLAANMTSPTSQLVLQTRFGYRLGDLLLLSEPGKNCVFMEVTGLPTTSGDTNKVNHDTLTYTLSGGASVGSRFNPAGGMGVTYDGVSTSSVARVFNLGNLHDDLNFPASQNVTVPVYNTYAISNGKTLTVQNEFVISGGVPALNAVADNIVHLRAEYGLDDGALGGTANDGLVDHYVSDVSGIPNWPQVVIAVHIAVVARSAQPEIGSGGVGTCDST